MQQVYLAFVFNFMFLASVAYTAKERDPGRASNCDNYECPKYSVLKRLKGYELRQYEPAKWAMTSMNNCNKRSRLDMYTKLRKYFGGNNKGGIKITRTLPVLRQLTSSKCFTYFLFPSNFKGKAPTPIDPEVSIVQSQQTLIYTKYFTGFKTFEEKLKKVQELKEQIGNSDLYYDTITYIASFDPPWKMFNRHNEVGLIAK